MFETCPYKGIRRDNLGFPTRGSRLNLEGASRCRRGMRCLFVGGPRSGGDLKAEAEGANHLEHSGKLRVAVGGQ